MIDKKDLVIVVLATFCLTATLFMTIPTRSGPATAKYDPLLDYNEDGILDMRDIGYLCTLFGEMGTAVNRTALLNLQSQIDDLKASVYELRTKINSLNATVVELETELAILDAIKLGKPDWNNTDWTSLPKGGEVIFTHNLNTTNVLVYMIGKKDSQDPYIHQMDYGGLWSGSWNGAYWKNLTPTTITVHRHGDDNNWNYVRVFMWILP